MLYLLSGLSNEPARTATHKQPRTSKAVVLIDENHYQVTVPLPSGQLGSVPVGSKVLRVDFEGVKNAELFFTPRLSQNTRGVRQVSRRVSAASLS